jgi:hypothetical protein
MIVPVGVWTSCFFCTCSATWLMTSSSELPFACQRQA